VRWSGALSAPSTTPAITGLITTNANCVGRIIQLTYPRQPENRSQRALSFSNSSGNTYVNSLYLSTRSASIPRDIQYSVHGHDQAANDQTLNFNAWFVKPDARFIWQTTRADSAELYSPFLEEGFISVFFLLSCCVVILNSTGLSTSRNGDLPLIVTPKPHLR
jgi:hypothetical protein